MQILLSKQGFVKKYVYCVLFVFVCVTLLNAPCFERLRFLQQILKVFLFLGYSICMFKTFKFRDGKTMTFRIMVLTFSLMLITYAIVSSHFKLLFPCLNVLFIFFFFYYYTCKGIITISVFKYFTKTYFVAACFLFFDTLRFKFTYLDSLSESGGMNIGYNILVAMLMLVIFYREKVYFLLLFISYLLLLFALKRGPIVCGSFIIFVCISKYLFAMKGNNRFVSFFLISISILACIYVLCEYSDIILRRFDADTLKGGSGRNVIYSTIYNKYIAQESVLGLVFGNGFYAAGDIPYFGFKPKEGFYAHSDFYELLWDFGLFGLILYGLLLFTMLRTLLESKIDRLFIVMLIISCLLQAYVSGVYTSLEGQGYFLIVGFLLGYYRLRVLN